MAGRDTDRLVAISTWKKRSARHLRGITTQRPTIWQRAGAAVSDGKTLLEAEDTLYRQIVNAARFPTSSWS